MKWILMLTALLAGCDSDSIVTPEPEIILVGGQSNGLLCDWSYFERNGNYQVKNISVGNKTISQLIDIFIVEQPISQNYSKMLFVHGESDSVLGTAPDEYISDVHYYQNLTGVDKVYFSLVGYSTHTPDNKYDIIREAVETESLHNDSWSVGFYGANTFRDRGMLWDGTHFNDSACREMMDGFLLAIGG